MILIYLIWVNYFGITAVASLLKLIHVNLFICKVVPSFGNNYVCSYIKLYVNMFNCILFCIFSCFNGVRAKFHKYVIILASYMLVCFLKFKII